MVKGISDARAAPCGTKYTCYPVQYIKLRQPHVCAHIDRSIESVGGVIQSCAELLHRLIKLASP